MQHTSASMQSTSEQSASLQGALPSHEKHLTALTRRSLLKAGGVLGLFALAGGATSCSFLGAHVEKPQHTETVGYTYHQGHCGGMCPLKCTVRDGRLVLVEPNTCCHDRYETICLKGISEIQHIYGAGRVQTPLKRVGKRGENKFVSVSWEEALDDIVAKLQAIRSQYGNKAVYVRTCDETGPIFLKDMLQAQGSGNTGIDVGNGNGLDPAIGLGGGYATATAEARDWVNSRLVLTVGSNFCESTLPQVRLFFEAKEAGARMITVDPHFSTTAGKSDEWIPIEPGTDAALFLGMIVHILDKGLTDQQFMKLHTSFPYLVDISTGKLLRHHEPDLNAKKPEKGDTNPFYVCDANTSAPCAYTQCANPDLNATITFQNKTYTTVFNLLKQTLKSFSVAEAARITHIPEKKICELAALYAQGPSSLALGWGGNDKMANADIAGHAAAVLTALTGNVGKPGAGVGVYVGGSFGTGYSAKFGSWSLPSYMKASKNEMAAYDFRTKPNSVRAAIVFGDDAAQHFGNMNVTKAWYEKLDLVVQLDPYFTEACKWSDYVLPLTTRFENDCAFSNIKTGYNNIVMQNKIIDPLFEAKTDLWVQQEIARRLGCADVLPKTGEDYVRQLLKGSKDPSINTLTPEKINEAFGVWPIKGNEKIKRCFEDGKFSTPSGRMDVYYEDMLAFNQQLPLWEAPLEAYEDNPLRERFPLQFANTRTRFRIHNQFNDAQWLQSIYVPTIAVNPADLEKRGIKNGDVVRVKNDRGLIKVNVQANEAIRPGCARLYEGATADFTIEGNMQELTNDAYVPRGEKLMVGPVIPFSDTLVEVEKA